LKRSFWTLEKYEETFKEQRGKCAICEKPQEKALSADHDHLTNSPRGLLCNHCNLILGKMNDSPALLEKSAAYLRKWGKI
jgi:hypothetical protein